MATTTTSTTTAKLNLNAYQQRSHSNRETQLSQLTADEYRDSILEHLIDVDLEHRPDPTMIDQQPEIEWKMWPFLVDGLVEIHSKLKMRPQTLFLAINIMNRYCARRIVYQKHFHLVGCTSLWIASKYEDQKNIVPTLSMLKYMTNGYYPEKMFVMMESHILNTLEWSISHCTVDSFLQNILSSDTHSPVVHSLCSYIAEITLYHQVFVGKDPLVIAKAITILADHLLNVDNTPISMNQTTSDDVINQWVLTLADLILSPPRAVLDKYQSEDRHCVTQVVDSWVLRRQKQAQELAIAKATAAAKLKAETHAAAMYHTHNFNAPLTPPSSNASCTSIDTGDINMINPYEDLTPPNSATFSRNFRPESSDSPLTQHSLASLTSFGSVTSLASNNSMNPTGVLDMIANSPPVTPLNPPQPHFRA